jgi:hypothetical protein
MMDPRRDELRMLRQSVARVSKQAEHLSYSLSRLDPSDPLDDLDILERYEALTARFSRLQDTLIGPFRTIAIIELEDRKAERIPDLLNLMEKRDIVPSASEWPAMRRLRNAIAHEYWDNVEELRELFTLVMNYSKALIDTAANLHPYVERLEREQSPSSTDDEEIEA